MLNRFFSGFLRTSIFVILSAFCLPAFSGDFTMQVAGNDYLSTQGFDVMLYDNAFHPVFVDEKNTAMQMILHGERIATNGDVRLMPTPEQWDLVAKLKGRHADKEHNRLSADLSFASYQVDYRLEVAAEPGGIRVSVNLDKPLPDKLAGRAGFNLEFLPSIYMDKTYAVDDRIFGIFPRSPQEQMHKVALSADDPKKLPYQEQWDEEKGYTQPLPIVSGNTILFAPEDRLHSISITSETAPLSLFDGRNRAQNGWFVLRTLIPSGKTEGAIVWHIRPNVIPNWTRPPMVAHSQVGYGPKASKIAIIELDPKFDAPKTAKVLRLTEDGTYKQVFEGPISEPTPWLRYTYAKFDFSSVKDQGLYAIEYAGCSHRSVSHCGRRLQQGLAVFARWISRGGNGSCLCARGISLVARGFASRRRAPGAAKHASLRRSMDGSKDRFAFPARRAYSGAERGRVVRRGRLRYPRGKPIRGHRESCAGVQRVRPEVG